MKKTREIVLEILHERAHVALRRPLSVGDLRWRIMRGRGLAACSNKLIMESLRYFRKRGLVVSKCGCWRLSDDELIPYLVASTLADEL